MRKKEGEKQGGGRQKFAQKEGARDGTRTHVGMSKGLDLVIEEKEEGRHEPPSEIEGKWGLLCRRIKQG
jgi:hypothetical protein